MLCNAELGGGSEDTRANPELQERCGLAGNTVCIVQAEQGGEDIDNVTNRGL